MNIRWNSIAASLMLALAASAVSAAPAVYYRWHSRFNDYTICSQTPPGPGWEVLKGPYKDAQCSKPASGQ
ncbi:MAG: hypothetical protein V4634_08320 [Pseudomonadota bacterium]